MHLTQHGEPVFGIARWDLTAESGFAIPQAEICVIATASCAELAEAAVDRIDNTQHQYPEVTWSDWSVLFCGFCVQREMPSTHSTARG